MEVEIRPVVISDLAIESLENIYIYGLETFSYSSATVFVEELYVRLNQLSSEYLHHPVCRFIPTKTGMYRNLQHGRYLVIYRIKPERIEVLNIIHSSRSPSKIKAARKIKV
ncbi:type II toxin-antitoxin system RelE/ParE family toxin [Dyadobacter fermentans]|uniref:type II toxin-antitoxin system RelE/ParE family toxin n=1 Tax=Dyadobacter fermentans TaxID=94254 RepID=UPI001CBF53F3|nr:type II toxin-antitoxin system RelE/ParE family toxin [Dyadobacter fermentans]MBZ1361118.1 type II toxin-antitoxin system RelE/ParE family toxin [Dyadobacter fermentans]